MLVFEGYHGTDRSRFSKIQRQGFKYKESNRSFPCDLGVGVYFYIERSENDDPMENAKRYVKKYKKNYNEPVILKAKIHAKDTEILDFNEADNQNLFDTFKKNNKELILEELRSPFNPKAKRRGNFDGIVIEVLLRSLGQQRKISVVVKDTFTNFETIKGYKISNFPNGREMCVRNNNLIKNVCICD